MLYNPHWNKPSPTPEQIVIEAARVIERRGFNPRGDRGGGPLCVIEAINAAMLMLGVIRDDKLRQAAYRVIQKYIGRPVRVSGIWFQPSIIKWAEKHTRESVIAGLREAAGANDYLTTDKMASSELTATPITC